MLAIAFRFPGGRYHATPWGRHVNEAAVAWPPEPWRLLRALLAVWHRKLDPVRWPRAQLAALLDRLAAQPPQFHLPPSMPAHSRHYLPTRDKTTLVFDAFLRIETGQPVHAVWPTLELDAEQLELLDTLLDGLGYLGRAESWVEAVREAPPAGRQPDCVPVEAEADAENDGGGGDGGEMLRLLAARPAAGYAGFRSRALTEFGRARRIADTLPADWLDALAVETGALQKAGWNRPPAAIEIPYRRRPARPSAPRHDRRPGPAIDTVRYALYGRPLPRIEDAIRVGEWLRSTVLRACHPPVPALISGHDLPPGNPHAHAFWLAESAGGDGRIDHVLIHVPDGIPAGVFGVLADPGELREPARRRSAGDGDADDTDTRAWQLLPEWFGRAATPPDGDAGRLLGKATVWRSTTPYLHPWHVKRGFGAAEQIRRECRERGLAEPEVRELEHIEVAGRRLRPLDFHRFRRKPVAVQPDARGHALELRFPEPVSGPLALGFGCHFGLGVFGRGEG